MAKRSKKTTTATVAPEIADVAITDAADEPTLTEIVDDAGALAAINETEEDASVSEGDDFAALIEPSDDKELEALAEELIEQEEAEVDASDPIIAFIAKAETLCDMRANRKPEQTSKWAQEKKAFITPAVAQFLVDRGVSASFLEGAAIYMVQKVRKLAQFAIGAGRVDPATVAILRNALDLNEVADAKFTPAMQMAALSPEVDVDGPVGKLKHRQTYSKGTASAQSNTTRQALVELKLASDANRCLAVKFDDPLVMNLLGLKPAEEPSDDTVEELPDSDMVPEGAAA